MYPVPPPHIPNASYNGQTSGVYYYQIPPPNHILANHQYHPHFAMPMLPPPLPNSHIKIISPHIAEWMKIADDVVGPHPSAKPLSERVATQAEIDLISGHIHTRWAHDPKQSQPTPVTALGPAHDTQKRFGHLVLSTSVVNTRGRFPFGDDGPNRFEQHVSPSTFLDNDSTARPEYKITSAAQSK
jgi:hypothetical protein